MSLSAQSRNVTRGVNRLQNRLELVASYRKAREDCLSNFNATATFISTNGGERTALMRVDKTFVLSAVTSFYARWPPFTSGLRTHRTWINQHGQRKNG